MVDATSGEDEAATRDRPLPVLLAMNNPLSTDPAHVLYPHPAGCAGWRLWTMLNEYCDGHISRAQYLRSFERRNLLNTVHWSTREARLAGDDIMDSLAGRVVVVFGVQTLEACRIPRRPWGEFFWHHHLPTPMLVCSLPHPSGRCREYNDPEMRQKTGRILCDLMVLRQPSNAHMPRLTAPEQGRLV